MPLMKVTVQRKGKKIQGWRYGPSGHVYTGPGARAKALLQMHAMFAAGYKPGQ